VVKWWCGYLPINHHVVPWVCLHHSCGISTPISTLVSSCSQWQWGVLVGVGVRGIIFMGCCIGGPLISACSLGASCWPSHHFVIHRHLGPPFIVPMFVGPPLVSHRSVPLSIHPLCGLCSAPYLHSIPSHHPWPRLLLCCLTPLAQATEPSPSQSPVAAGHKPLVNSTVPTYGAGMIHTKGPGHIDVCIQANYGHHKYCNIPWHQHSPPSGGTCTHPSHSTVPSISTANWRQTAANTLANQCSQHYHLCIHTPLTVDIVP